MPSSRKPDPSGVTSRLPATASSVDPGLAPRKRARSLSIPAYDATTEHSSRRHLVEGEADLVDRPAGGPPRWLTLTDAERRAARLLALGADRRDVAGPLFVTVKTADDLRINVLRKLGLRSTVALARYAIRHGLVGVECGPYEEGVSVTTMRARERARAAEVRL